MSRIGLTDRQWAFIRLFGICRSWFTVAVLLVCIRRLMCRPSVCVHSERVCCPVRRSYRRLVTFSGEYAEVVFRAGRGLCSGSTAPVTYLGGTWECSADGTKGGSMDVELREVTPANWQDSLHLAVSPDQQRFVADYTPIVAIALAKAYLHLGGATWIPYAIYAGPTMVGFVALAYESGTPDQYWIFHFFIDHRYQGRGYGGAALRCFIELVKREHPTCQRLQLVVHPENRRAQRLYLAAGFSLSGAERWGEPVYQLAVRGAQ